MKTLTEKQRAFCAEYVANGYNAAAAYRAAYNQDNKDVAKAEGNRMLKLEHIKEAINQEELDYKITGHGLGINKECILNVIKRALDAKKLTKEGLDEDWGAQLKAIEVYAKLTGDFSPEKRSVTIDDSGLEQDIDKMTPEEREAYKAKILASL